MRFLISKLDFANEFIGGGVLNSGCVQEEIRFMICPELLVTMLFTERMEPNETILIKGCERYENKSFAFIKNTLN